ncbi:uncharacterized protein LOC109792527 [Cajanus cajan]|uniref:uncharacterized protein LOC109792527 n=1 Tax=Cajanus cajan TaxID=3821 RepID=UPI00098DC68C|nr:uncharacterized protein LOC109792527 [Cajanus cajan]
MMTKNEMKTIRIVIIIMIMMDFVQANHNPPLAQIDQNNVLLKGTGCAILCGLKCVFTKFRRSDYEKCIADCDDKCYGKHHVYDCFNSCSLTKSIDNNIDTRGLLAYVMDSCFQKCQNK